MLDVGAVLIVIVAWIVVREGIRRWVRARAERDAITVRQAAFAYSAAIAMAPLFLLPWRHSVGDVVFLSAAAVVIFLGKYALISYSISDPET